MIQFKDLKFQECPNFAETGNSIATITVNEYQLDIIKKPSTRTYKVKSFEMEYLGELDGKPNKRKIYIKNEFPQYGEFPEFAGRELLLLFLNALDRENLSGISIEIDENLEDME